MRSCQSARTVLVAQVQLFALKSWSNSVPKQSFDLAHVVHCNRTSRQVIWSLHQERAERMVLLISLLQKASLPLVTMSWLWHSITRLRQWTALSILELHWPVLCSTWEMHYLQLFVKMPIPVPSWSKWKFQPFSSLELKEELGLLLLLRPMATYLMKETMILMVQSLLKIRSKCSRLVWTSPDKQRLRINRNRQSKFLIRRPSTSILICSSPRVSSTFCRVSRTLMTRKDVS